ncbi:predicted protein [Naegleria gruberi]|uniref:Predicted protein n=1 Tax=Naegleria gruberi TaxID=5762 RepID=D2VKW4_NAEGR|nr:uncharacterized protein NAEGRDRAFT_69574 [Naegleria gruberi]EFC42437.1 predicted protein [Naegleria gruberi]|eukprot:XP_002675181.1 predicted protein [Naegleria gruberi strain NEG-M]
MSSNREFVLQTVQIYPNSLEFASSEMKQEKQVILKAIETEWKEKESRPRRESTEFTLSRMSESFLVLRMASLLLHNDREFCLDANKYCNYVLSVLEVNRDLVLDCVKTNGKSLASASHFEKTYLMDLEIVTEALKENLSALENVFHESIIYRDGFIDKLREIYKYRELENRENLLNAVRENGFFLMLANDDLKNDREIVLAAVEQNGWSIRFANKRFTKDKEIIKVALDNDWKSPVIFRDYRAFMYVDKSIMSDKEFILEILPKHSILAYVDKELLQDRSFVLKAAQSNPLSFKFFPKYFQNDREIFIAALNHPPQKTTYYNQIICSHRGDSLVSNEILGMVNDKFRSDKELVLCALKLSGYNLKYASESLKEDVEIIDAALSHSPLSIMYAGDSICGNEDFILQIVKKYGVLPRNSEYDRSFALKAVSVNGLALKYFKVWKTDKEVIIKAVQQNYKAIEFSPRFWEDPDVIREALRNFYSK